MSLRAPSRRLDTIEYGRSSFDPRVTPVGSKSARGEIVAHVFQLFDEWRTLPAKNLDLVVVVLEARGDHARRDGSRVVRGATGVRISPAIILYWLDIDTAPLGHRFTPWHASR